MSQPAELRAALTGIADLDTVGVDVERADWDRYWRTAALIQVGGDGHVVLVDPLAITDLADLDRFLSERLVVLHAMENDLPPLEAAGVLPSRVADTAVAAGVLGLPTGLSALLSEVLDISLAADKQAMQRADWEARPLDPEMLAYAAADVADLPALWRALRERLTEQDRMAWYAEDLQILQEQPPPEERRHWARVKGVGRLDPAAQGRARALWEIRERLAQETDTAPGRIFQDKVLVQIAEDPPDSLGDLPRRGVRRQAVRRFGEDVMHALGHASAEPRRGRSRRVTDADRKAADALRDIRAARATELGIDPGLLCPSRTLLSAVLSDPQTPDELADALGLRRWQWQQLGTAFCKALGLGTEGNAAGEAQAGGAGGAASDDGGDDG